MNIAKFIASLLSDDTINTLFFLFWSEADKRKSLVWSRQLSKADGDEDALTILGDLTSNREHFNLETITKLELIHELAEAIRHKDFLEENISAVYCEMTHTLSYPNYSSDVVERLFAEQLDGQINDVAKEAVDHFLKLRQGHLEGVIAPLKALESLRKRL